MKKENMPESYFELADITYEYACPTSNYLEGTEEEMVTERYDGPARLVVHIDKETLLVEEVLREWEAFDGRPLARNHIQVVVEAKDNPLLCEVLSDYHNNHKDAHDYEETNGLKSIPTPDGYNEFTYEYPIHPDELYDDKKTKYALETKEFTLYRNKNVDIIGETSWDETRDTRNRLLIGTDGLMAEDIPEELKQEAKEYRQKLRDLPEALKDVDLIFIDSSLPTNSLNR